MENPNDFCLVMIVRDESRVIERCLESVKHLIDDYVICDTGSIDNTVQVIDDYMKLHDKTGCIIHKEWVNFGYNKSYLLQEAKSLTKCKYIFWLDADEIFLSKNNEPLTFDDRITLLENINSKPTCDIFYLTTIYSNLIYSRWNIVRNNQLYMWKYPAHEQLEPASGLPVNTSHIDSIYLLAKKEGKNSQDVNHNQKYINWFKEYLLDDPEDTHCLFYLAQSLQEEGNYEEAISYYDKRISVDTNNGAINGYTYISSLRVGRLYKYNIASGDHSENNIASGDHSGNDLNKHVKSEQYLKRAIEISPYRLEAIYELICLYADLEQYEKALPYITEELADQIANPSNLFTETDIYDWKYMMQASYVAHKANDNATALIIGAKLLILGKYPDYKKDAVISNLKYFKDGLKHQSNNVIKTLSFGEFKIRDQRQQSVVIDNFFVDPDEVRRFALNCKYEVKGNFPGARTRGFANESHKNIFEKIIGRKITYWPDSYNGSFQYTTKENSSWIHRDNTDYSAMIYLTPNAPLSGGTNIFRHIETGLTYGEGKVNDMLNLDSRNYDKWEIVEEVKNVYNRCVIFDGRRSHQSNEYFGTDINNGRLFMIFFFDVEK